MRLPGGDRANRPVVRLLSCQSYPAPKGPCSLVAGQPRRNHLGPRPGPCAGRYHWCDVPVGLNLARCGSAGLARLAEVHGQVYAVVCWAVGCHRHGVDLAPHEAAALGRLLGNLHTALAEVMAPRPHAARRR